MVSSSPEIVTVLHSWAVPAIEPGEPTTVVAEPGRVSLFLGTNGAGKSALGYWMRTQVPDTQVVHLRANRQLWFASSGPTTAPAQRGNVANNLANQERQQDSRWIDRSAAGAIELALLDIVIATNRRDQEVANLVESESSIEDVRAKSSERPVDALNREIGRAHV